MTTANIENRARTIQSNVDAWTPEQHALVEAQASGSADRRNRAREHVSLVSPSSDAQLVTPDMLNWVVAPLDQLQASIQNFQYTNDVSGLTDNLIDAISLWPAAHAVVGRRNKGGRVDIARSGAPAAAICVPSVWRSSRKW